MICTNLYFSSSIRTYETIGLMKLTPLTYNHKCGQMPHYSQGCYFVSMWTMSEWVWVQENKII